MWDKRFSDAEYVYGTEPNDFLAKVAPELPTGAALCLAAGEGRNAVYLAGLGYDVTAVDGSQIGLNKATALATARKVAIHCVHSDLGDFSLGEGRWDLITAMSCHLPPAIRDHVFSQIPAALRPGGSFVMEGYTQEQLALKTGGPPEAAMLFDEPMMRGYLKGLEFVRCEALRRPVLEGKYHTGEAAVLQVIAKRPA